MKSFIIRRVEKDERGREGERFLTPPEKYRKQHPDYYGWVTEGEALEALRVYFLPNGGIAERKRYRFILVAVYTTRTDRDVREI